MGKKSIKKLVIRAQFDIRIFWGGVKIFFAYFKEYPRYQNGKPAKITKNEIKETFCDRSNIAALIKSKNPVPIMIVPMMIGLMLTNCFMRLLFI